MTIERTTTVRIDVRTTVPAGTHVPIKQYPHIEDSSIHFRAAFAPCSLGQVTREQA